MAEGVVLTVVADADIISCGKCCILPRAYVTHSTAGCYYDLFSIFGRSGVETARFVRAVV